MKIVEFYKENAPSRSRTGAGIFDKQEPEPHKNGPALQH
jgi:hypothetical protein